MSDVSNINHRIEAKEVLSDQEGAFVVSEFVTHNIASKSEILCVRCGAMVPVPDGSLKDYVLKRFAPTAYIAFIIHHQGGGDGQNLPPFPANAKIRRL